MHCRNAEQKERMLELGKASHLGKEACQSPWATNSVFILHSIWVRSCRIFCSEALKSQSITPCPLAAWEMESQITAAGLQEDVGSSREICFSLDLQYKKQQLRKGLPEKGKQLFTNEPVTTLEPFWEKLPMYAYSSYRVISLSKPYQVNQIKKREIVLSLLAIRSKMTAIVPPPLPPSPLLLDKWLGSGFL